MAGLTYIIQSYLCELVQPVTIYKTGDIMKTYKVLITSTLGKSGQLVELPDNSQTNERLKKGIVAEVKIVEPEETKAKRKPRAKK